MASLSLEVVSERAEWPHGVAPPVLLTVTPGDSAEAASLMAELLTITAQ